MILFQKQHLKFKYSRWATDGDNSKYTGEPDKTLLNRSEGYEVFYFVRKFMSTHNLTSILDGETVEVMIHDCPGHLRSRENIYNWIVDNWENY